MEDDLIPIHLNFQVALPIRVKKLYKIDIHWLIYPCVLNQNHEKPTVFINHPLLLKKKSFLLKGGGNCIVVISFDFHCFLKATVIHFPRYRFQYAIQPHYNERKYR